MVIYPWINTLNTRRNLTVTALTGVLVLAVLLGVLIPRISRADNALPNSLCALIVGRVICYDGQSGVPLPVTPLNDPVTDYAPSPDGLWLAYRAGLPGDSDEKLYLAPIGSPTASTTINATPNTSVVIDTRATPPADLRLNAETLAWAPNGVALAYLTAFGLRVSAPGGMVTITDQAYVSVHWSLDGSQLAAQTADGGWSFFGVIQAQTGGVALDLTRHFDQSAEIAWLDAHSVIAAPINGGLLRFDPTSSAAPVWTVADEHFMRLQSGVPGEVLAMHIIPGDPNGLAVGIDADGHWTPFGSAKLDPQLTWGPAPGKLLVYITSGTPIMVNRATGDEDMLPINHADRIVWRYGVLPEAQGVAMDADLYFIAPDTFGIGQVWRLPRDGFPLLQLTNSAMAVSSYQIGPDAIRYTAGNGGQYAISGLNGLTATPFPLRATGLPRATITSTLNATIAAIATLTAATHTPFMTVTPVPVLNPPYQLQSIGWQPGPVVMRRIKSSVAGTNAETSRAYLIQQPLLSPSGAFAAGYRAGRLMILNWATGQAVAIQGIQAAQQLQWG
jgi:hypothetical protein